MRHLNILCTLILMPFLAIQGEEDLAQLAAIEFQDADCDGATWTIGSAVSQALMANRNMITSQEAVNRADLNLEYEMTEFEWRFHPTGTVGFQGGGDSRSGFAFGAGVDVSKKWTTGTRLNFNPYYFRKGGTRNVKLNTYITQPLFRGVGYWYNTAKIQGAAYAYRSAVRNIHIARVKLITRVVAQMYEIVKQEEIVRFNKESYDRLKGYVTAARLKEKIGLSDSLDVYRAETELRHAEDNLTSAQERLQEAYDVFKEMLSLPLEMPVRVVVPMEHTNIDCEMDEAVSTALNYRIEMDQAYDFIYEQKRILCWAKQNMLPDLNLHLEHSTWKDKIFRNKSYLPGDKDDIDAEETREYYQWLDRQSTWGISFSSVSDLYQYGERLFYDNSLLNLDASYRNLEQVEVNVTLEVKRAMRTLKQASTRIRLQEEQIKTAEGELYLSQIKFDRGMANNFDVIQAERNLRTAHIAYLSAVIEHINGEYQLNSALGILAEKPCF